MPSQSSSSTAHPAEVAGEVAVPSVEGEGIGGNPGGRNGELMGCGYPPWELFFKNICPTQGIYVNHDFFPFFQC